MIIDSLGWAYYRLGRTDDAVRELEKAVELKPGDPVINDHLGDAYWKVGRKLEARFQWQHAKDSNPEPEDLEKIVAKFRRASARKSPPPRRVRRSRRRTGVEIPLPDGTGQERGEPLPEKGAPVLPVMAHMYGHLLLEHRGAKAWVARTERATTQAP